jgi:hypothetical protein
MRRKGWTPSERPAADEQHTSQQPSAMDAAAASLQHGKKKCGKTCDCASNIGCYIYLK